MAKIKIRNRASKAKARRRAGESQGQSLSGTVSGYNLNPGGTAESMMLSTGNSTVQLNFPPEVANSVQSAATVGSQITVTANSGRPGGTRRPRRRRQ